MPKTLFILGTRPEAVKMAPVIWTFKKKSDQDNIQVCITSQHKSMLQQVLQVLDVKYDFDLEIMIKNQSLAYLSSKLFEKLDGVVNSVKPDLIFVQGDTTSSLIGSLVSFYYKIPVAHIEAGLRTENKYSPFPEELNRIIISRIADFHFAPTIRAKNNLLNEGVDINRIWVTGNTVIDTLLWMNDKLKINADELKKYFNQLGISFNKKLILVTGHRRENFGKRFENICNALKDIVQMHDVELIYPVHLNPKIWKPAHEIIGRSNSIHLIEPLDYEKFIFLLSQCYCVLTDSGGIQEEAPSLNKPVLVMRDNTERPEGIEAGTAMLVGTDTRNIVENFSNIINNKSLYEKMSMVSNPYGDGNASLRIYSVIEEYFLTNSNDKS